jgi:hypothetical protein
VRRRRTAASGVKVGVRVRLLRVSLVSSAVSEVYEHTLLVETVEERVVGASSGLVSSGLV